MKKLKVSLVIWSMVLAIPFSGCAQKQKQILSVKKDNYYQLIKMSLMPNENSKALLDEYFMKIGPKIGESGAKVYSFGVTEPGIGEGPAQMFMIAEYASDVQEILSNAFSPEEADFKDVIEAHLFSQLTNEELALLTNRSLTAFKREFKRIYKDSPNSYIMGRKLEAAKERLTVSSDSISSIAFDCGFKDLSHFSKLFKNKMKFSPRQYRVNLKSGATKQ